MVTENKLKTKGKRLMWRKMLHNTFNIIYESCKDIKIFLYMAGKFDVIPQFNTYVLSTNDHMLIFQEDPADKKPCSCMELSCQSFSLKHMVMSLRS